MVSNSQHFLLADRKIKLQLNNPSELEPPNDGQVKIIILGIYSRFLQAHFFLSLILFSFNQHNIMHTKVNYYKYTQNTK